MKLSTKGRRAVRALLDLTIHHGEEPVLLKDIAQRQQISLSYLEHLIPPLIAGGLLRSTRGAKGGVSLVRPPEQVKLSEIIQLLEGSMAPAECITNPELCARSDACVTRDVYCELEKAVCDVLDSTSLQDLAGRQKRMEEPEQVMYYI